MNVLEIIRKGESEDVEFKKSLSEMKEILETVCAFLNTKGGTILIGVDDKGKVVGVDIGKGTIENLANRIRSSIEPPVFPSIEELEVKGKKIIVITVPEGNQKPYFYKGRAYKRVGKTNQVLTPYELRRILSKMENFENKIVDFEFDEETIKTFLDLAKEKRNLEFRYHSYEEVLEKLGLKNNIAGLLCFGKNPQRMLPYAEIQIGVFRSGKLARFWKVSGNIFNQIEESLSVLGNLLKRGFYIDEKGVRREVWEVPYEALREAVVNATVHRDYSLPSPVYIEIHEDKVIVENPGELPEPLTLEDLKKKHRSIPRNPLIANVFFLAGYIERWGTGTNRMIEACIRSGLREPEFYERKGFFGVVFYLERSEKEMEIIRLLEKRERTSKEISRILGISDRMAREYLRKLLERGIIKRIRKGRKIYYSLE